MSAQLHIELRPICVTHAATQNRNKTKKAKKTTIEATQARHSREDMAPNAKAKQGRGGAGTYWPLESMILIHMLLLLTTFPSLSVYSFPKLPMYMSPFWEQPRR